jgi:DNA-binding NarL/FixJ family response regulator
VIGEAADGEMATQQIMMLKPDVVLLDIRMPKKSGIDVVLEVRAHFPKMKIMVLSNFVNTYSRARCLEAGADYVFDKSTEFEAMIQMLIHLSLDQPEEPLPEEIGKP